MTACDLCGAGNPQPILKSRWLDGPLVRCRHCGLYYVGERAPGVAFAAESRTVTGPAPDEDRRLAALDARMRLKLIREFRPAGKLLEAGCARGDFLLVARDYFTAFGVERDPEYAKEASAFAPVHVGGIDSDPGRHFDVVASFRGIDRTESPKAFLSEVPTRLRAGGIVVLETPDIDSLPFRALKGRWRQFLPGRHYFFDRKTMTQLLEATGFKVERIERVRRHANAPLILNRLSRYFGPLRHLEALARRPSLSESAFQIDPLDIMMVIASKKER